MFASLYTVANCVSLAMTATVAPTLPINSENWDDYDIGDLETFTGLASLADFDVNTTMNNLRTCISDVSTNSKIGVCSRDVFKAISEIDTSNTTDALSPLSEADIRGNVVPTANADIAGPGLSFNIFSLLIPTLNRIAFANLSKYRCSSPT